MPLLSGRIPSARAGSGQMAPSTVERADSRLPCVVCVLRKFWLPWQCGTPIYLTLPALLPESLLAARKLSDAFTWRDFDMLLAVVALAENAGPLQATPH